MLSRYLRIAILIWIVFPGASGLQGAETLRVCSFNIKFLGNSKDRDNAGLAAVLKDYDLVFIQELVAPPYNGSFPDGKAFKPDKEAQRFFDAMRGRGFQFWLSEEDTGAGKTIHLNSTATEWWVAFFKTNKVQKDMSLPTGFLAADRSHNADFDRVPYAFGFKAVSGGLDFVAISVHLKPDASPKARARRRHEILTITKWVLEHNQKEKDFLILGDMNMQNEDELNGATPAIFLSLNNECRPTNAKGDKPYDHVMYLPQSSQNEVDTQFDFAVIDLVAAMRSRWKATQTGKYPGDSPFDGKKFEKYYSDHDPVEFRLRVPSQDDD